MVSYIKKKMDENGLFSRYTIQSLLDELDTIEYYQQPGKAHHLPVFDILENPLETV